MTIALFDYDPLLFAAGGVGEKRYIRVVHRESGEEYDFPNRTAFHGHWKKREGGWLAEDNKKRLTPRHPDEFDISDVQVPEPLENCLYTLKQMIFRLVEAVGADEYYGYSGRGKVFREDVSTILRYKANRIGSLRPLHLDAMKDYLVTHHDCKIVERIEADDACTIDSYEAWQKWKKTKSDDDKLCLIYADKDYLQIAGHLYNINGKLPVCSYDGFGWLELNKKGDVKGRGRMWLYYQIMSEDTSDNYAANCASNIKWGSKSAYNLLKDCKNDMEALTAMVKGFKTLYPEPKKIVGWRGEEIEIDWMYVMQECATLAHMLRFEGDAISIPALLKKLNVPH